MTTNRRPCADQLVAPSVVDRALDATVDAADGESIGLVEVRHRLVVLMFAILDDDVCTGPVSVDRKTCAASALARITEQPFEAMLAKPGLAERAVA